MGWSGIALERYYLVRCMLRIAFTACVWLGMGVLCVRGAYAAGEAAAPVIVTSKSPAQPPPAPPVEPSDLERGLALFQQRAFAKAAPLFERARRDPQLRSEVLLLLAICYYRLGDLERSEPLLQRVVREGDGDEQAAARVFLGQLFQQLGATDQARSEFSRVAGAPSMRDSGEQLLHQSRPHRLLFTLLVSPEYDGNLLLTDYATWAANQQPSSDGDVLFLGSVSARPFSFGLHFGSALSYRQQFFQTNYNLLLSSTWLGYSYFGRKDRVRLAATFNYAMLGGSSLFLDGDLRLSYRRALRSKLGLLMSYDGHYRGYQQTDFSALTGFLQTLQLELNWGLSPQPVSFGIGYQGLREQTRTPDVVTSIGDDYRAWAHGPTAWLRARLHSRVELSLYGAFLQRIFDYVPGPELPSDLGVRRLDLAVHGELSLTFHLTSWLDLISSGAVLYNDSNKEPYTYLKPLANLSLAAYLGVL